jgi:hypothetical protein
MSPTSSKIKTYIKFIVSTKYTVPARPYNTDPDSKLTMAHLQVKNVNRLCFSLSLSTLSFKPFKSYCFSHEKKEKNIKRDSEDV